MTKWCWYIPKELPFKYIIKSDTHESAVRILPLIVLRGGLPMSFYVITKCLSFYHLNKLIDPLYSIPCLSNHQVKWHQEEDRQHNDNQVNLPGHQLLNYLLTCMWDGTATTWFNSFSHCCYGPLCLAEDVLLSSRSVGQLWRWPLRCNPLYFDSLISCPR